MKHYTVLVLRPDYIAASPADTYLTHCMARDVLEAKKLAQKEAAAVDSGVGPYDDYEVLAVFAGIHNDIKDAS